MGQWSFIKALKENAQLYQALQSPTANYTILCAPQFPDNPHVLLYSIVKAFRGRNAPSADATGAGVRLIRLLIPLLLVTPLLWGMLKLRATQRALAQATAYAQGASRLGGRTSVTSISGRGAGAANAATACRNISGTAAISVTARDCRRPDRPGVGATPGAGSDRDLARAPGVPGVCEDVRTARSSRAVGLSRGGSADVAPVGSSPHRTDRVRMCLR